MKLVIEIKTLDGTTQKHECVDFPSFGGDFITLYKKDFVRENIRTASVDKLTQYFKWKNLPLKDVLPLKNVVRVPVS